MLGVIPPGASARVHLLEVRKAPRATWQTFARAPDRATAVKRMRELLLHLPADCVRLRPLNPSDPDALHRDDEVAVRVALHRGHVTEATLATAIGDDGLRRIRVRAASALRRARDANLLRRDPGIANGAHVLTERGRTVALFRSKGPHDANP